MRDLFLRKGARELFRGAVVVAALSETALKITLFPTISEKYDNRSILYDKRTLNTMFYILLSIYYDRDDAIKKKSRPI